MAVDARQAVEHHAPLGSVQSEEMVEAPFVKEAEVPVKGILAIVAAAASMQVAE